MIEIAMLTDAQKYKLQKILEMNQAMTCQMIEIAIGNDAMAKLRSLLSHGN